jgi:hypothetical protein
VLIALTWGATARCSVQWCPVGGGERRAYCVLTGSGPMICNHSARYVLYRHCYAAHFDDCACSAATSRAVMPSEPVC